MGVSASPDTLWNEIARQYKTLRSTIISLTDGVSALYRFLEEINDSINGLSELPRREDFIKIIRGICILYNTNLKILTKSLERLLKEYVKVSGIRNFSEYLKEDREFGVIFDMYIRGILTKNYLSQLYNDIKFFREIDLRTEEGIEGFTKKFTGFLDTYRGEALEELMERLMNVYTSEDFKKLKEQKIKEFSKLNCSQGKTLERRNPKRKEWDGEFT